MACCKIWVLGLLVVMAGCIEDAADTSPDMKRDGAGGVGGVGSGGQGGFDDLCDEAGICADFGGGGQGGFGGFNETCDEAGVCADFGGVGGQGGQGGFDEDCDEAGVCPDWAGFGGQGGQGGQGGFDEGCDEAGVCADFGSFGGAGGDGGFGGEPGEIVFNTLIIFDDGSVDIDDGLTGADFCSVTANCASAVSVTLVLGDGSLCQEEGPGCQTSRTDAVTVINGNSSCTLDAIPSDFTSLGRDGQMAVGFDGDLTGCEVTVLEWNQEQNGQSDAWVAYVCDSDDVGSAFCVNNDLPEHEAAAGGNATFEVPAE